MNIRHLHYFSGIIISLFIALHLFNHLYSILGVEQHIALMETLRAFYRNIVAEAILLSAVLLQIISGLKLFLKRRKTATTAFEKLHLWSGFYLALFFIIHIGAVLGGRYFLDLDTNFYFGVAGLNTFPFNLFFIPYYSLAILAFFGHIAAIHQQKMRAAVLGLNPNRQAKIILVVGVLVTIAIFYGLTNHFNGVEIPEAYQVLIGK